MNIFRDIEKENLTVAITEANDGIRRLRNRLASDLSIQISELSNVTTSVHPDPRFDTITDVGKWSRHSLTRYWPGTDVVHFSGEIDIQ